MSSTAYLIDHPPARSQYLSPRREDPSGVVAVHTAENAPDFVAFDGGAEAVASWISRRSDAGSYHEIADSDSAVYLVPYTAEAFHDGTGTNRHSLGLSCATRADVWPLAPQAWRDGAVEQMAQAAARMHRWVLMVRGFGIPPRRITAAQARARVPGCISHAELDPTRRTDPGAGFPWTRFLTRFAELTGQTGQSTDTEEGDVPLDSTDITKIREAVRAELNAGLIPGQTTWAKSVEVQGSLVQSIFNYVRSISAAVDADDVNEAELAAVLAPAIVAALDIESAVRAAVATAGLALSAEQVTAIADATADELGARLGQ
jgi:hypothetical protein